jgi:hypothetical protein
LKKPLALEEGDQQLIAALLRNDGASAREILNHWAGTRLGKTWADSLHVRVTSENLCPLIWERLWSLELLDAAAELTLSDGRSVLELIRQESNSASVYFTALDELFLKLSKLLGERVIWIKGPALSRTLYDRPQLRAFRDFDVIVCPGLEQATIDCLTENGFVPLWHKPGACAQFGIGPVGSFERLCIAPSPDCAPGPSIVFQKEGWPLIELKFDPLELGLRMKEIDRFFGDRSNSLWRGSSFLVPSTIDHLILELTHLHKHGFEGWHWLYDIHLLCSNPALTMDDWQEIVRRCRLEEISYSAWAGLRIVTDRLATAVPEEVFEQLQPPPSVVAPLRFLISTEFLWHSATLPELLLNAFLLGDRKRKLRVLREMTFPSKQFLRRYYLSGGELGDWVYPILLIIHLLVLVMPAGLTRRTIGRFFWQEKEQEQNDGHCVKRAGRASPYKKRVL